MIDPPINQLLGGTSIPACRLSNNFDTAIEKKYQSLKIIHLFIRF
jgi:hypothetical protein